MDRVNESVAQSEQRWNIHGVGIRDVEEEKSMFRKLKEQDGLYGLLGLPSGEACVVKSVTQLSHIPSGGPSFQHVMGDAIDHRTKILSLTVTEKGYCQDASGDLDTSLEDVRHDIMLIKRSMNQSDFETLRRDPCRTYIFLSNVKKKLYAHSITHTHTHRYGIGIDRFLSVTARSIWGEQGTDYVVEL